MANKKAKAVDDLLLKIEELQSRLSESEEALNAIRNGEVDAIIVTGKDGDKVFSISSAETPYRIILEEMAEGVVVVKKDGTILYRNKRFSDIFLDTEKIFEGSNISEIFPDKEKSKLRKLLKHGLAERVSGTISYTNSQFKSPLYLSLSLRPIPSGIAGDVCIIVSDITIMQQYQDHLQELVAEHTREIEKANNRLLKDLKQLEEAKLTLEESENKYRELIKFAPSGIYEVDFRSRKFTSVNDSMCLLTGYSREEFLSMTPFEMLDDDGKKAFQIRINKWLSGEKPDENIEYKVTTKDGHLIYALLNVKFKADEKGNPIGALVVAHDITERKLSEEALKKSEQELRQSEEKFRNMVKYAPAVIYEMDIHGTKFISVNDTMCQILGYPREELLSIHPYELLDQQSRQLFNDRIIRKLKGERIDEDVEYMVRKKDGDWIYTLITVGNITVSNEVESTITVIAYDITERKKMEDALRMSEKKFMELVKNAPTAIYEIDFLNKKFISVNDAFCKMSGYSRDEVLSMHTMNLLTNESKNIFIDRVNKCLKGEKPDESVEYEIIKKDGSIINAILNMSFNFDDEGKVVGALVVGHNITERKRAEEELKEARDKLNIALENGEIGIWEWDLKTDKTIWDERMEKMFDLKPGKFGRTYKAFENLINEEDISHVQKAIRNSLENDLPFETIFRARSDKAKAKTKYISSKALINKDKYGKPISFAGVCFDVTSLREGTEKLVIKLNEDLLRSNKELESFAYVTSHDLQEPLRMVTSFTQLLEQRYKDKLDKEAQEYIHFAVDGANRMYNLLNGLLAYSRIHTRGKTFVQVDINHVLENVKKNLALAIRERNAVIEIDELPVVFADESQMILLFQNLIANSIKFSTDSPTIYISSKSDTVHHIISVKDEGMGIEPQYFEKIFQIFQRLHPKEQYEGTGIGLAICKRIVERHSGKIWVESEYGKGSTFFFTISKNN